MRKKPVYVLQIGMTRNHGGLETYLLLQFRALDKSQVHYDLVNITGEYDIVAREEIIASGSQIFSVNSRHLNPIKHYYQWIRLLSKIHARYDAIILNTNSLEYVFPLVAAKWFGIPRRIIHSHNSGFENRIGLLRKLLIGFNRVLLRGSATHYFACSEAAGRWMFGESADFTVIHNAIEPERFTFNYAKREEIRQQLQLQNKFVLGHVGRFSYQKNHVFLLYIFAEVVKRNPESILLLVGNYASDDRLWNQCKEKAETLGLTDKVMFLGERKDVPDLFQAMDCFVFPSHFEGLGIVGIEAQASGLPCYFSDTITKEVGITDLAHFLSLGKKPADWAEEILAGSTSERRDRSREVREAGYDIRREIVRIQDFYLERQGRGC